MINYKLYNIFYIILFLFLTINNMSGASMEFTADVNGINSFDKTDKILWSDSKGYIREAYFAKEMNGKPTKKGYITRLVWKSDINNSVVCNEKDINEYRSGLGYTINHINNSPVGAVSRQTTHGFDFTQEPIFIGKHHLIYRVQFKQYATNYNGVNPVTNVSSSDPYFKVTVDWFFADGLDYIIYAITFDCSDKYITDDNPFNNDSRSPYSAFDWDGDGSENTPNLSGFMFGTDKKFITYDMNNWTYQETNIIPFVYEWIDGTVDKEMGIIQTETYSQHTGGGLSYLTNDYGTSLPVDVWRLPYQMNGYQSYQGNRITWGLPYGAVDGGYGSTAPYQSYSVSIMIDNYSDRGVTNIISENANIHNGNFQFNAVTGCELVTSDNEGINNPNIKTFSPEGYNHIYRVWELTATTNKMEFEFNINKGSFLSPVFVINNYSVEVDNILVKNNNVKLTADTGYYASFDSINRKLYITVVGKLTGNNRIYIGDDESEIYVEYKNISIQTLLLGETEKTVISFNTYDEVTGEIYIYNIKGDKVYSSGKKRFSKGINDFEWDGKNNLNKFVSDGIYIFVLHFEKGYYVKNIRGTITVVRK